MKSLPFAIALWIIAADAHARPSMDAISSCIRSKSTSPKTDYTEITTDTYNINKDDNKKRTEQTFKYKGEILGTWKGDPPDVFGLIYNTEHISLRNVRRLSKAMPASFDADLATWALIREGPRSYLCIAFNFEGVGQSGSFQSVHGVYLVERGTLPSRTFYTVGRVTANGVILSK